MARPKKVVTPKTEIIEEPIKETEEAATTEAAAVEVIREKTTPVVRERTTQASRPHRVSLADQRDSLTVEARPGFVRRWVNDIGNRIERFKRAGYTPVEGSDIQVGDTSRNENNVSLGSGAQKNVGRTRGGDNTVAVLMEIPEEWYNEDQAKKQIKVDETEAVIKRKLREKDFYGEFKQGSELRKRRAPED